MTNIYEYLHNNFGIDISEQDYQFKRDYIINPLKIIKGRYERPFKEDLEYLYLKLNIDRKSLLRLFNIGIHPFKSMIKEYKLNKSANLVYQNYKKNCLKKHGVDNYAKVEIIKQKQRDTLINKYGVDNYAKTQQCLEKIIKTNRERYGVDYVQQSSNIKDKSIKTCLSKYNVDRYSKTNECKQRIKETKQQLYNDSSYNNRDNAIKTCLNRYGCENPMQNDKIKEGSYNTKRQHNTFNKSKPEDLIYDNLCTRFDKVLRQYRTEQYPFNCDFYIPEIDTYIEYNGYWSHGKEPFNPNNEEHTYKVKLWESKSKELNFKGQPKKHYQRAITNWTITDPNKRQIAKQNGLNYLEFFNLQEFNQWFNNICK